MAGLPLNSFLYSWRKVRFKSIPLRGLISHAIAIGVQQLLITYSAFKPVDHGILPHASLWSFSLTSQLSQELRD